MAARRAARARPERPTGFTPRFLVLSILIAAAAGYVGFSFAFPNMPFAVYVGVIVAVVAFAAQVGLRLVRRRAAGG